MGSGEIERIMARQHGVMTRRQALGAGLHPHDLERFLRRREWVRLLPGVFVDHTGTPTWMQLAWAGVLRFWPAALSGASAVRAVQGPRWRGFDSCGQEVRALGHPVGRGQAPEIELVVSAARTVTQVPGYAVTRTRSLEGRVQWNASPPRIRFEEAVLDLAGRAPSDTAAIGLLADACQSRRTTAARLLEGLVARQRVPRRAWLIGVLDDIANGTCSALEHAHLSNVERPHGLPRGQRQAREPSGSRLMFRDVRYRQQGVLVELDGRLFHDSAQQHDADLERDLDVVLEQRVTVRLGWGQCTDRACATAARLARLLQSRGWQGEPRSCGQDCVI